MAFCQFVIFVPFEGSKKIGQHLRWCRNLALVKYKKKGSHGQGPWDPFAKMGSYLFGFFAEKVSSVLQALDQFLFDFKAASVVASSNPAVSSFSLANL